MSTTTSSPRTRAITSSLIASRSSPSIPPSTTTYQPLVKAVLRHRLIYSIFPYSAVLSWLLSVLWTTWDQDGGGLRLGRFFKNSINPEVWVWGAVGWAVGVLPVLVMRKIYLTTTPTTAPSPSKTLQNALQKPNTLHALLVYQISAILLTFLHILMLYASTAELERDPKLTVFVRSRKHPYYLNGRFLFLLLAQMVSAGAFWVRNIMLDRFAFRSVLSPTSKIPNQNSLTPSLLLTILTSTLLTTLSYPLTLLVFFLSRSLFLPILIRLPLFSTLLRPMAAHFVFGPRGMGGGAWTVWLLMRHLGLVIRAWFLGVGMALGWEWAEGVFDSFVKMPITISNRTPDPALALISGITPSPPTSPPDYYTHFAYTELRALATDPSPAASARRTALFGDQKYMPSLWSSLVREGLVLLGKDYQVFLGRGKAPAPTPVPAPTPKVATPTPATAPHTPLIKKPILRSSQSQPSSLSSGFSPLTAVLDSFASDSKLSHAVEVTADAGAERIPELFRSVEGFVGMGVKAIEGKDAGKEVVVGGGKSAWPNGLGLGGLGLGIVEKVKGKGKEVMNGFLPAMPVLVVLAGHGIVGDAAGWTKEWWNTERVGKVVEGCLPRRELDVLVIEVLTHLTCASLTEDRYGVVQRDIPRILEALLSFLTAVEAYQAEIEGKYKIPTAEELAGMSSAEAEKWVAVSVEVGKAGEALGDVAGALKDGVARITRTFGDKLLAFKFPPRVARKLQGFIDYN